MYLLSEVHMHPDHLELRKVLANFIMQNARRSESQLTAASRVAESTIVLQLSSSKRFVLYHCAMIGCFCAVV